jgi:hypothetical protein
LHNLHVLEMLYYLYKQLKLHGATEPHGCAARHAMLGAEQLAALLYLYHVTSRQHRIYSSSQSGLLAQQYSTACWQM